MNAAARTSTTSSAFLAVARERSFTRAAAQLGVSQSALSHTVRGARGAAGPAAADPHHPQRRADRGGRAPAADRRPALRGDRDRAGRARASCATSPPAPSASPPASTPPRRCCGRRWSGCCRDYPGHQGRDHRRLRPDRHRRPSASTPACGSASRWRRT